MTDKRQMTTNEGWQTTDDEQWTTVKNNGQQIKNNRQKSTDNGWRRTDHGQQTRGEWIMEWMMDGKQWKMAKNNGQWMTSNGQPGKHPNCPPPLIFLHEMHAPCQLTMDSDEQGIVFFFFSSFSFLYLSIYLCFLTFTTRGKWFSSPGQEVVKYK